jgi:hypothetical protein
MHMPTIMDMATLSSIVMRLGKAAFPTSFVEHLAGDMRVGLIYIPLSTNVIELYIVLRTVYKLRNSITQTYSHRMDIIAQLAPIGELHVTTYGSFIGGFRGGIVSGKDPFIATITDVR